MSGGEKAAGRNALTTAENTGIAARESRQPLPAPSSAPRAADARAAAGGAPVAPDPAAGERPVRRKFTAEFKWRIVEEANACTEPGQVGELLRRHGLYSSHLVEWRAQYRRAALSGLAARKRGPKAREPNLLLAERVERVERETAQLRMRLRQAETRLELQEKVGAQPGIPLTRSDDEGE
jgi:transposase-like protein